MKNPIMLCFTYDKFEDEELRGISRKLCDAAFEMDQYMPAGVEKEVGLRKLLEAKDCLVRQAKYGEVWTKMSGER